MLRGAARRGPNSFLLFDDLRRGCRSPRFGGCDNTALFSDARQHVRHSLNTKLSRSSPSIGGGPAGLMAAEALAAGGVRVDVYDAMPSVGRKFLMAGKGGMNLTHSEAAGALSRALRRARRADRAAAATVSTPRRCGAGCTSWASKRSSAVRAACFQPT